MSNFTDLPIEMRELIFKMLTNHDLLHCRLVSRDFIDLARHVLDQRHQTIWSWNPYFSYSDDDQWINSKMVVGVVSGGLPACCSRHNFESAQFKGILTTSLLVWIEDINMSIKLNRVVSPLLLDNGSQLTSFTLALEECKPNSIHIGNLCTLLGYLPNLRNFAFKVCNCSVRQKGLYQTRGSHFPPLPQLEVLDLEFNENAIITDSLLEAYGYQVKRLSISGKLLEESDYLQDVINQQAKTSSDFFKQLRELKIARIIDTVVSVVRPKPAGEQLFPKLATLPTWYLERLSLNIGELFFDTRGYWKLALPQLIQLISKFAKCLKELYISFESEDINLRDWFDSDMEIILPEACPNLKKVSIDSVTMKTPILIKIFKSLGNLEEIEFIMWYRVIASTWRGMYELFNLQTFEWPLTKDLPVIVDKFWKELPSLQKVSVLGKNDNSQPPEHVYIRNKL